MVAPEFAWPVVEAHRGYSRLAPENTMAAFRLAAACGAPAIELDIHFTRDGVPVVMHDADARRTTGVAGPLAEMTLEEVRRLDAGARFGPGFAGEPVPTLEEALAFGQEAGVAFNVEVKAFRRPEDARVLVGMLREYRLTGPEGHVVSSFDREALLAVRDADAGIPLCMLGKGFPALHVALTHGFERLHTQWRAVNRDLVARAHAEGMIVMAWTLDDASELARLARLGVDRVCTNDCGLMLSVVRN